MRKKILLVDDNALNRKLIQNLLITADLEVIEAKNGRQAIEMAISQHPSLILLAVKMSAMSGKEVFSILRQNSSTWDIPIIALSDQVEENEPAGISLPGFNDMLISPIPLKTLAAKIQPYVDISKSMKSKKMFPI